MKSLLGLLALVGVSIASPAVFPRSSQHLATRDVSPPTSDPFYNAPSNLSSYSNGDIISSRDVSVGVFGIVPLPDVQAWQLLYKTSSANGSDLATVTTVFKPANATGDRVVGFNTAEDSDAAICAPSYNYQLSAPPNDIIVTFETLILEVALNQGWIISSPDYEGPDNAFAPGRLEGHAVLDGLTATLAFSELGLSSDVKVAGFGYSGGAIATGWAAALQPTYSPDLPVVGFAHGGTPANLSGTLSFLDGTLFSGFGFAGITGLANTYQSVHDLFEEIGTDLVKAAFSTVIEKQCAIADIVAFAFEKLQSTAWQSLGDQLLYHDTVQEVAGLNILGRFANETPTAPVYIYHAQNDEIIPVVDTDTMVNSYCANGIKSLVYERDVGIAEHASLEILAVPNVIKWISDRFDGVPAQDGCSISNVTTTLADPGVLGEGTKIVLQALNDFLKTVIGLSDDILTQNVSSQAKSSTTINNLNSTSHRLSFF